MDQDEVTTVVGTIVAIVALLAVILRFYSRHTTRAAYGWDDWLVLIALLAIIATDVLVVVGLCPSFLSSLYLSWLVELHSSGMGVVKWPR